jgi:hypothetical protein
LPPTALAGRFAGPAARGCGAVALPPRTARVGSKEGLTVLALTFGAWTSHGPVSPQAHDRKIVMRKEANREEKTGRRRAKKTDERDKYHMGGRRRPASTTISTGPFHRSFRIPLTPASQAQRERRLQGWPRGVRAVIARGAERSPRAQGSAENGRSAHCAPPPWSPLRPSRPRLQGGTSRGARGKKRGGARRTPEDAVKGGDLPAVVTARGESRHPQARAGRAPGLHHRDPLLGGCLVVL